MARGTTVRVDGLREVDAALSELPRATGKAVLRRVAMDALKPMAEEARRMAPDDPSTNGRDLKNSIAVGRGKKTKAKFTGGKGFRSEAQAIEMHMGPAGSGGRGAPPQGLFQEFGTVNHPPQPFMRPAWDAGKDRMLEEIKDKLWAEISKASKRLARKSARLAARG